MLKILRWYLSPLYRTARCKLKPFERSLARLLARSLRLLAAFNCSVSLRRSGKRRLGQRGRSGESQDADEAVRGRHQEPVERPGDPGMLHSEEGVPALRLGQVVSV